MYFGIVVNLLIEVVFVILSENRFYILIVEYKFWIFLGIYKVYIKFLYIIFKSKGRS